jgi:hypothetical protein
MPAAITCIFPTARRIAATAAALLLAGLGLLAAGGRAHAMAFAVERGDGGRAVVVARGAIEPGDAERLRQALQRADRDPRGHRQLQLDSLGGNVAEAFAMAEVMDAEKVATVVRSGRTCASACAVILFTAGAVRIVESGGRLGVHTCYDRTSRSRVTSCNEAVAKASEKHGVPFIAIFTLMQLTAPGSVRWLDAETAACWRLSNDPDPPPGRKPPPADPSGCTPPPAEPATGPTINPVSRAR